MGHYRGRNNLQLRRKRRLKHQKRRIAKWIEETDQLIADQAEIGEWMDLIQSSADLTVDKPVILPADFQLSEYPDVAKMQLLQIDLGLACPAAG